MQSLLKKLFGGANPSPNERWVDHKPPPKPKSSRIPKPTPKPIPKPTPAPAPKYGNHIHKRNGEYWFGNKPVKYLIRKAREQGLIVAPKGRKE